MAPTAQQDPSEQKKPDTFFAGTISEVTPESITHTKVRVTVRYSAAEDGDIATLIVVRPADPKKK